MSGWALLLGLLAIAGGGLIVGFIVGAGVTVGRIRDYLARTPSADADAIRRLLAWLIGPV